MDAQMAVGPVGTRELKWLCALRLQSRSVHIRCLKIKIQVQ